METHLTEHYHQIKLTFSYDDHYLHGEYDNSVQTNELLNDWLKKEKPMSYRLLNAETLFIEEVKIFGRVWVPRIQHILHISYVKNLK